MFAPRTKHERMSGAFPFVKSNCSFTFCCVDLVVRFFRRKMWERQEQKNANNSATPFFNYWGICFLDIQFSVSGVYCLASSDVLRIWLGLTGLNGAV